MDNFTAVCKILHVLERSMDSPELDVSALDAKALDVSEERWARYIEMMADIGYIKGVRVFQNIAGYTKVEQIDRMRITLKGLEYLQENSLMKRAYSAVKGIAELVP